MTNSSDSRQLSANGPQPVIARSPWHIRTIRAHPWLYYSVSQSRLCYSRYCLAAVDRYRFRKQRTQFAMSSIESGHCAELKRLGYTVLPDFVVSEQVQRIYDRADELFCALDLEEKDSYSVQRNWRTLQGLSYDELASSEKMISLKDPLLKIPEIVDIAYDPRLLKIVGHFLGYAPRQYKPLVIRDFPLNRPRESSNFHRDNDERDSVQIFIYLVDINDRTGPLIYVPGTNWHDLKSCRPRLTRDLDQDGHDGRISDEELAKYYPPESWATIHARAGSAVIVHGNGFHKGPAWPAAGSSSNLPRTALRIDIRGDEGQRSDIGTRMSHRDSKRLAPLQRLFARRLEVVD